MKLSGISEQKADRQISPNSCSSIALRPAPNELLTAEVFDVAWVRRELDAMGIPPLKRFGQHFLVDKKVRDELIDLARLTADDTVWR